MLPHTERGSIQWAEERNVEKIFEKLCEGIPDYKTFLNMDEMNASSRRLAENWPDVVKLEEIGKSRKGESILCLKIGNGKHTGLMFGCPHPNEPVGTMMLEYFTERLAEDRELREALDYTWYIVKVWDIDGFRLNEKWLKGPYTLFNYSRNFFRPAGHQQVDWTFPIDYKKLHFHNPLPETTAMMDLIDRIRPEFIYALHNAGFGGVYWYLTEPTPEIYEEMYDSARQQKIPVNYGEPEVPYLESYAPAIYKNMGIQQDYDYLERYTDEDMSSAINAGNCSADYAKNKYGSFTLLTELPYFYDQRIDDGSGSGFLRKDVVLEKCRWSLENNRKIKELLDKVRKYLHKDNPFLMALDSFGGEEEILAEMRMAESESGYDREATVAEKFDNQMISKFYMLLSYGMLVRAVESELEADQEREQDKGAREILEETFLQAKKCHRELADTLEKAIDYKVVPVRKLVAIQLRCGLLISEYLKERMAE